MPAGGAIPIIGGLNPVLGSMPDLRVEVVTPDGR